MAVMVFPEMCAWRRLSTVSQLAAHLRAELASGRWRGKMPGVIRLAGELGVARNTVEAALRELEREGLLIPQGAGRGRIIDLGSRSDPAPALRLAILIGEAADLRLDYLVDLRHQLAQAGHSPFFPTESLAGLGMDVKRIARLVRKTEADAWVVMAGSIEVLRWFASHETPAFALFGRRGSLPIAGVGPDKIPAMATATRALLDLGHRRIVMLTRARRRLPEPGTLEQVFLSELSARGIVPGSYHLPDWSENAGGFHACLDELFRVTPPTALILDEEPFFVAAIEFCANRGIRMPRDVSMICSDANPSFAWYQPSVAHIRWDSAPVVRRIVRWASNIAGGKEDLRQTLTPAEFVPGGTIGPVK